MTDDWGSDVGNHEAHVLSGLFFLGCTRCEWLLGIRAKLYHLPTSADLERVVKALGIEQPVKVTDAETTPAQV